MDGAPPPGDRRRACATRHAHEPSLPVPLPRCIAARRARSLRSCAHLLSLVDGGPEETTKRTHARLCRCRARRACDSRQRMLAIQNARLLVRPRLQQQLSRAKRSAPRARAKRTSRLLLVVQVSLRAPAGLFDVQCYRASFWRAGRRVAPHFVRRATQHAPATVTARGRGCVQRGRGSAK